MQWMNQKWGRWVGVFALMLLPSAAFGQAATANITGRATDSSGGALPGVTVSITSPNMIGGARTAVTDDQGVYRFTLLPGGELHRQVRAGGLHHAQHRRRQPERRRHDDDQRQAGRGDTAGKRHRHQPVADHRPRSRRRSRSTGISRSSTSCRTAAASPASCS